MFTGDDAIYRSQDDLNRPKKSAFNGYLESNAVSAYGMHSLPKFTEQIDFGEGVPNADEDVRDAREISHHGRFSPQALLSPG